MMKKFLALILAMAMTLSLCACGGTESAPTEDTTSNSENAVEDTGGEDTGSEVATTMLDIQKWYEDQMPTVNQSLMDYSQSVDGISDMNVSESKFFFGEDSGWYDCNYTFYFDCKVNGEACMGEARAFMRYNESEVSWFHFEIVKDSDWSTIVDDYDEAYDQIIEDHYKELSEQYS